MRISFTFKKHQYELTTGDQQIYFGLFYITNINDIDKFKDRARVPLRYRLKVIQGGKE